MTIPPEHSVTKVCSPSEMMSRTVSFFGSDSRSRKAFQPVRKWKLMTAMLMSGAMQVASAAPRIPIFIRNMNSQSRKIFAALLLTTPAIASRGAPSLRRKQTSRLFITNAGAKRRTVLR